MKKAREIGLFGKILTAIGSVLTIVFACSNWLLLEHVPILFGELDREYTLFEVSDFLEEIGNLTDSSRAGGYSMLLFIGAATIIVLSVICVILAFMNKSTSRVMSVATTVVCIFMAVFFVGSVNNINKEIHEESYGLISGFLVASSAPYLTTLFSLFMCVGVRIHKSAETGVALPNTGTTHTDTICPSCGAHIKAGVSFCDNCGARIANEPPTSAEMVCSNCDVHIKVGAAFCDNCGNPINSNSDIQRCSYCGSKAEAGLKFCTQCGKPL